LDGSGALISGATVEAVNAGTNETSRVTTDASGVDSIPFLRPGQYTVTATQAGFKTAVRE
jgi:uncharacterized surface anchored protein